MNIESLRTYCISKNGVEETFPFDDVTLVFKVMGKIFLIIGLDNPSSFNVKCDPELAIELRERHPEVIPGFHMNKQHWNTVHLDGDLGDDFLHNQIDNSYSLIVKSLSKKLREKLNKV